MTVLAVVALTAHLLAIGAPPAKKLDPKKAPPAAAAPEVKRPTVLVVPFATASAQEYAAISHGSALALNALLLESKEHNVITVPELSQLLRRRDLLSDTIKSGPPAAELATVLGADFLITGSFQARWPDIMLAMRIVDGKDGKVITEQWELAKVEDTLGALDRLSAKTFAEAGWPKPKSGGLGTTNIYAWREVAMAAEQLAVQPFAARPRALVSPGALRKARLHCEAAVKLDPKWGMAQGCLAYAAALNAVKEPNPKDAELALEIAQKSGGHWLGAFATHLARVFKKEDKEAGAALEAALAKYPGLLSLSLAASEHHQMRGAHAEAKNILEKALVRAPEHPLLLVRLGKSLVALGEGDKGLEVTSKAVERSGGDAQVLVELGSRQIDLAKLTEAEATLKQAMQKDSRDGRAYLRLGYVYLLQKKPQDAIKVLERSIAESDLEDEWRARAFAHFDLARAHGQLGAVDQAFKELELAIDNGFEDRAKVEGEQDFIALGKDPRWTGVLEKMKR